MKKFFTLALTAVMALSLLTACGSKDNASDDNKGEEGGTTAALSGTVSTDGSTSMEKVINSLGESFMAANKDVKFTYNPTGSSSGIQAVTEGRCDIGLSSRALKDDEKASGLVETVLAYDGIAIVVSPENPISDLDVDTIAKIYTGEITNWKDVGGDDAEIVLIGREAGSGTRNILERYLEMKSLEVTDFSALVEAGSIGLIKQLVEYGCGITFLYRMAVMRELEEGRLCEVKMDDMNITHDFTFIWREGSIFHEDYQKIYQMLKKSREKCRMGCLC